MRTPRALPAAACSLLLVSILSACGEDDASGPNADPTSSSPPSPPSSEPASEPASEPTPSPAPTSPVVPVGDSSRLTLKGLPTGAAPAVPYLTAFPDGGSARSLVRPDGTTLQVEATQAASFAPLGEGLVLLDATGEETEARVIDGSGAVVVTSPSRGYRVVVSPNDPAYVSWLGQDGKPMVFEDGDTEPFPITPVDQGGEMGALQTTDSCTDPNPERSGCTVFVNARQAADVYFADSHGQMALVDAMLRVVDAAADGRLLGLESADDLGSCSGIYVSMQRQRPKYETCDYTLTQFSSDGERVLGTDAYLDGFGQRTVAFLDARLQPEHVFTSTGRGASVLQTAWEDADHALAVVYERGQWAVLRLGTDGSAEVALGPVAGSDLDPPYSLPEQ